MDEKRKKEAGEGRGVKGQRKRGRMRKEIREEEM